MEIRNLSMGFNGEILFSNVNLTVVAGQIVTIIGESGVGKTTLLRAIAGLLPFNGDIVIDGRPVRRDGSNASTGPVVLVTQQPNLWDHLTALDNVALVRRLLHNESKKVARASSLEVLHILEVHIIASRYPHSLSGGEQQRVGLARGLATEKPILLLDEVTSNIDLNRRGIVARVLLSLVARGRSIIFVTHDLNTAHLITERPLELTRDGLKQW
jgi:ABC-type polar amino acid transport system ATPase subunit